MHSTVLITGTNRGLGLFLVKEFLEEGFSVYSISRSMSEPLQGLRDQYEGQLTCYQADVTRKMELEKIKQDFSENKTEIDILINNAAVHLEQPAPDLGDLDFEKIQRTLEVNAVAPLAVVQSFYPFTRSMIVNFSSEAGSIGNCRRKSEYGYCMSKAALNMASKVLHNRLADENIKVLAVHPQWFQSDMGGSSAPISPAEAAAYVKKPY